MAYNKLIGQGTRMLDIIPSDTAIIPFPGNNKTYDAVRGTTTITSDNPGSGLAAVLQCSSGDFINRGVQIGDIVYNVTTRGAGLVISVDSATQLQVDGGLDFSGALQVFSIYSKDSFPCRLWLPKQPRSLAIVTAGGDSINLSETNVLVPGATGTGEGTVWYGPQIKQILVTGTFGGVAADALYAIW